MLGDLYTVFASSPSSVNDRQSVFYYCHFRGSAQRSGKTITVGGEGWRWWDGVHTVGVMTLSK